MRDVPALLARYHAGELELDGLISSTFSLEQINEAFDEVRAGVGIAQRDRVRPHVTRRVMLSP